jgi:hypothetical protein
MCTYQICMHVNGDTLAIRFGISWLNRNVKLQGKMAQKVHVYRVYRPQVPDSTICCSLYRADNIKVRCSKDLPSCKRCLRLRRDCLYPPETDFPSK